MWGDRNSIVRNAHLKIKKVLYTNRQTFSKVVGGIFDFLSLSLSLSLTLRYYIERWRYFFVSCCYCCKRWITANDSSGFVCWPSLFVAIKIIKQKKKRPKNTDWDFFFFFFSWENIYWLVALQWPIGCHSQPKRNWFPDDTRSCGSVTVTLPFIPKGTTL